MAITVTVAGESERRHPAERATVTLSVGFEGHKRDEVLARSARLHGEVVIQLGTLHSAEAFQLAPVVEWSTEQVRVWGQRPWSQTGEQLPIVFHSAASVSATFVDFAALSRWVGEVSLLDGITVNGVVWALSDATQHAVESAAQRDAVAAAVAKADVYAQSLGFTTVTPLAISDVGLLGDDDDNHPMPRMAMAMDSSRGGANGSVTELKPEEIRVTAAVNARFSAS